MRQIYDGIYMTVESVCEDDPTHVMVWVTSHAKRAPSAIQRWPRPKPRADGFLVLDKPGDEAYMLLFLEPDGRQGVCLWPVDAAWTKEELWADIERHKQWILDGKMGNGAPEVPPA
jgi:hypothetical protein